MSNKNDFNLSSPAMEFVLNHNLLYTHIELMSGSTVNKKASVRTYLGIEGVMCDCSGYKAE